MIELRNINKTFKSKRQDVSALRDVSLSIKEGEIFGIIGFSGAGKSTLVRCINLLERPTSGEVVVNGENLVELKSRELNEQRKNIGMIFQQFNLLEQRTVERNVRYPLEIAKVDRQKADKKVRELLELVGLKDKISAYPSQLSGGQKQRVAIARALATNPKIILCDEATSALDPITTKTVLDLLKRLNKELGVTIVVITHELSVVERICDRVAVLEDGEIQEAGDVSEVFLEPKSDAAKKLISAGSAQDREAINLAKNFLVKKGVEVSEFDVENFEKSLESEVV